MVSGRDGGSEETGADEGPDLDAPVGDDDELWEDLDREAPARSGVSPVAVVLGAIAVLGLIVVLVATGGSGSDPSKDERATTKTEADGSKTTTTKKSGPTWPAVVQGRPAIFGATGDPITSVSPDAEPGVYVWMDYDGWHLWVVDPSGKAASTGTLVSDQPVADASIAEAGQGSAGTDGNNVIFDVTGATSKAAGVNFNLGFYATEVTVNLGGNDLPLLLGTEAKPSPIPTVIAKAVQPS